MQIHFIGIGGIGISALAKYYLKKGNQVSGSDLASSETTKTLKRLGARLIIGKHRPSALSDESGGKLPDLVVYSPAVPQDNPEIKEANRLGIRTQSYPQALGELTKKYWTIAISGTHGKGTTTAMTALSLIRAGLDPTVIIGTKLKEFSSEREEASNCRIGQSKYLIIEADEYRAAFFNYWPKIIVLTNIDREHLDYFKDLDHALEIYEKYIFHLPKEGVLVANQDDVGVSKLRKQITNPHFKIQDYSLNQPEAKKIKEVLKIPGTHNVSNALAVLSVARVLEIADETTFQALSSYQGAWRRFEVRQLTINGQPITVISDYAHHPTEIEATLEATREKFPRQKIWVVFQPHQHQRTYYLFDEFSGAFGKADEIVLTKIYDVAGREQKEISQKVSSKDLAEAMKRRGKKVHLVEDFRKIPQFLEDKVKAKEVILVMGAGTIYEIVDSFSCPVEKFRKGVSKENT